ncbi:MAG TPA: hypothetical protein DCY88_06925 [Cyanobacteria bacterium UBA11372]|nr:hypothetical protein [Cyanobacteria bacterium UBA11372]
MSAQEPVSPWSYKPWWCQPWSILLVGITLIVGSWVLLKTWWVTVLVAIPVSTWMGFFLLIWPQLMRQSGVLQLMEQQTPEPVEKSGYGKTLGE